MNAPTLAAGMETQIEAFADGAGMVDAYFEDLRKIMQDMAGDMRRRLPEMALRLERARQEDALILVMGNGGSAAEASHLANDINKYTTVEGKKRYRALCLTDAVPFMTALSNDLSYADAFAEQVVNMGRPGDVLIGISGSGNSENCVRAMTAAKERGVDCLTITGYGGGRMAEMSDIPLVIPSHSMVRCEDVHVMAHHCLATLLTHLVKQSENAT